MPARDDEGQERRFQIRIGQEVGKDMPFQVVDANQGLPRRPGKRFCRRQAHQQGPHKTRSVGHGHGVDIGQGHAGLGQGRVDDGQYLFHMFAGRDFRHDTAKLAVHHNLGGNDVRQDLAPIFDDSRRRLVTAALDA